MKKWGIIFIAGLTGAVLCYFVFGLSPRFKGPSVYNLRYSIRADLKHPYDDAHDGFTMDKIISQISFRLENRKNNFRIEKTASDQADVYVNRVADTNQLQNLIFNRGGVGFWETYQAGQVPNLVFKLISLLKPETDSLTEAAPPADSIASEIAALKKAVNDEEVKTSQKPSPEIITFENGQIPDINTHPFTPEIGYMFPADTAKMNALLRSEEIKSMMPADMTFAWGSVSKNIHARNSGRVPLYFLRYTGDSGKAYISNKDILVAEYGFSPERLPIVNFTFNKAGAAKWKYMTGKNIDKFIAIQFDELIITCPKVESEISKPESQIHGGFTVEEAIAFASEINAVPLPVPVEVKSIRIERAGDNFFSQPAFMAVLGFIFFGGLALFLFKALKNT